MKYRTIVADPPWPYPEGWPVGRVPTGVEHDGRRTPLAYPSMSWSDLANVGVDELAERDAHLYLWATARYLEDAYRLSRIWEFEVAQPLVWAKTPMGIGPGGAWSSNVEFVLFCRRGRLATLKRHDSAWFNWPRTGKHSTKPEAFLDMVEATSPGPYLELFARRNRLGWDTWGNEALEHVGMDA